MAELEDLSDWSADELQEMLRALKAVVNWREDEAYRLRLVEELKRRLLEAEQECGEEGEDGT